MLLTLACHGGAAIAAPSQKAQCIAAAEATQELRDKKQLVEARAQALRCTLDACPAVVRNECVVWLREIEEATPSLVFRARDESGQDLIETRVLLDGKVIAEKLDGSPVRLDPGEHSVRFEPHDASRPAVEQKVLVPVGEKNRVVTVQLVKPGAAPPTTAPAKLREPAAPPVSPETTAPGGGAPRSNTIPWVAAGVGFAGLATFGVFQGLARSQKSELDDSCGLTRTCSDGQVSSLRTKLVVSGAGLGVGVLGLVTAGAIVVLRGPAATTAHASVAPGFAGLSFGGGFLTWISRPPPSMAEFLGLFRRKNPFDLLAVSVVGREIHA